MIFCKIKIGLKLNIEYKDYLIILAGTTKGWPTLCQGGLTALPQKKLGIFSGRSKKIWQVGQRIIKYFFRRKIL